jgi:hypothetical protein
MGNGLRRSILAQSVHGVYTTGTSRRVKRCKDSSRGQDRCGRKETNGIFRAEQQGGHRAGSPESSECSRRDSGCGQAGAFSDDERYVSKASKAQFSRFPPTVEKPTLATRSAENIIPSSIADPKFDPSHFVI